MVNHGNVIISLGNLTPWLATKAEALGCDVFAGFAAAAPLFKLTRLITIGMLPPLVREGYGFEWDARRERAYRRAIAFVRRTRRILPTVLREWPIARVA